MINARNQRRLNRKTVNQRAAALRRGSAAQLPDRPEMDEVFRLEDDGTGRPMFYDIPRLRAWAKSNLETKSLALEPARALRMLETGQVDLAHVMSHTIRHKPEPIILCRDASGPGEDAIVDGAHRYVAATMGSALISGKIAGFYAYDLTPDQWRPFVLDDAQLAEIARRNA